MATSAAVAVLATFGATSQAAEPRVSADYFGANFQGALELDSATRDRHLDRIANSGINQVRAVFPWRMIQPTPPPQGGPVYSFTKSDRLVEALARHGLTLQLNVAQAPDWASPITGAGRTACYAFDGTHSLAPWVGHADLFGAMMAAIATRYGRNGLFWQQNPALPYRPIDVYEIWNEQHLRGAWCPRPEPEVYADYFVESARAIRAVDSQADVIVGGLGLLSPNRKEPDYLAPDVYLRRAVARQPQLPELASGVAVHAYPGPAADSQLKFVSRLRDALRAGNIPNKVPMLLNEIGWYIKGDGAFTEEERVTAYNNLTRRLSRTNCNISGILQHAWRTSQVGSSRFEWVGIAYPASAELYPSGQAFVDGIALMRGKSGSPPRATERACEGMPLPDQDADGVRDENDDFPLDPSNGGGGSGGGGGGSGGGDGGSGGGDGGSGGAELDGKKRKCTPRLVRLTRRMIASSTADLTELTKRYRRVERRCVPCKRRIARINRALRKATPGSARELRARRNRIRRRCAPCVRELHRLQIKAATATDKDARRAAKRKHERIRRKCNGRT